MSLLITLFARNEPGGTRIYKDRLCTELYVRYRKGTGPTRRRRAPITLNCWPWRLEWLPDEPALLRGKSAAGLTTT